MNRKAIYSVIIMAGITTAAIWYFPKHTWTTASMDGASGGGFGAGGRGVGFSSATWKSLGGEMMVDEVVVHYASAEEARKDFEGELKDDGAIVERDNSSGGNGRLVKVFGDPHTKAGAAKIIKLRDNEIRVISAASLQPALTFEKAWLKL